MKNSKKILTAVGCVALTAIIGAGIWQVAVRQQSKNYNLITLNTENLPQPVAGAVEENDVELKPVKIKRFDVTQMDVDEAILQMEMLEHNFFVFLNSDTQKVNVVYKRADGEYGMLDPIY